MTPLLCADIGNSHTTIGLLDDGDVVDHWRVATDERRTADEWGVLLKSLLNDSPVPGALRGVSVCATVPAVLHEWRDMLRMYHGDVPQVIVEPGVRTGVPVLMDNPREVGTDRIINALAASQLFGGPAIVVDFGTSTNFDVVSERGEFLGGALAPGIEISVDALAARAARLLKVELVRPRSVIGKSTVEALQSGIIYGFAGQIDGLVRRISAELDADPVVIATGGLAPLVLEETETITEHEPDLTLIGLRLVFERNTG